MTILTRHLRKLAVWTLLMALLVTCMGIAPAAADDEWKELRIEVFNRDIAGFDPTNCMQQRYIQEHFGDPNHIKVTFVPVPRTQEVEMLNILMGANDAPDMVFTYTESIVTNYISLGGVTELDDLIAEYGPNLQQFLETTLPYGVWGGKQYAIPARRMNVARQGAFIRKDWLDALNLPVPTTKEEWYNAMVAFKEAKLGGEETIPFAVNLYPSNVRFNSGTITESFITEMTEEEFNIYATTLSWLKPGFKEGYRLLNKMYNEGLISPNFALDKDGTQFQKDLASGKAGFFIGNVDEVWRAFPGIQIELEKTIPEGQFVAIDCFEDENGVLSKESYAPNGIYIFVPSASKMAKEVVMYLDWMCQPENLFFLQNGVMGQNYESLTEAGIPQGVVPTDQTPDAYKMHATDLCIVANGAALGSDELNVKANAMIYGKYEDLVIEAYQYASTNTYFPPHFTVAIDSDSKYGQMVMDKEVELFVQCISASPDTFDAVYDALVQELLEVGGQAILDERKEAFAAGNYTKFE